MRLILKSLAVAVVLAFAAPVMAEEPPLTMGECPQTLEEQLSVLTLLAETEALGRVSDGVVILEVIQRTDTDYSIVFLNPLSGFFCQLDFSTVQGEPT